MVVRLTWHQSKVNFDTLLFQQLRRKESSHHMHQLLWAVHDSFEKFRIVSIDHYPVRLDCTSCQFMVLLVSVEEGFSEHNLTGVILRAGFDLVPDLLFSRR